MEPSFIEVAVYTLGNGKGWRNGGRLEYEVPESFSEAGVYANVSLHWWQNEVKGRVLVYNLTEEKFREHLSPPPVPPEDFFLNCYIGKLGGVLYYAFYYIIEEICCDTWLLKEKKDTRDMKELGKHEPLGWSKVFSLPEQEPLSFTKSGGVLCFNYKSLDIYDATSSTSEKLVDFGKFSQIFPLMNTLVSLKELGEGDIKVMETAGVEETKTRDLSSKQLTR